MYGSFDRFNGISRLSVAFSIALGWNIASCMVPIHLTSNWLTATTVAQTIVGSEITADQLFEQALQHYQSRQFEVALQLFQQALATYQTGGDRLSQSVTLNNMGAVHQALGQYPEALRCYQQTLTIAQETNMREDQGMALSNIGKIYRLLGQYPQALEYYQQALSIAQETGDWQAESLRLNRMGMVYQLLGQQAQALDYYQQALSIVEAAKGEKGKKEDDSESMRLRNVAALHYSLGSYQQALDYYQQTLAILTAEGDRAGVGTTLSNIGGVYYSLKDYDQALDYYQRALFVFQEIGDRAGESRALNNIGLIYRAFGKSDQALTYFQQALTIRRETGDWAGESMTLNNFGSTYYALRQYPQALDYHQQALVVVRGVGDRVGEGTTLNNIGYILAAQQQPEAAIVFLKQAVNTFEMIRRDLQVLEPQQQQSYTETVAGTYRKLADLLLSQGRILEAQQVLDLLKLEELREYTRDAEVVETEGIALNPTEQKIIDEYGTIVAFGQKVVDCERSNCAELERLLSERRELNDAHHQRLQQLIQTIRDNRQKDDFFYDPTYLNETAREIVAEPGTVLIYPFVQNDRLWLIWTAAGDVMGSRAIDVNQQSLGETVVRFRALLQNPRSNLAQLQATGQQLYNWLIQPIETELRAKGQPITHLVFAQDRILRYVPMAALFDGDQYLIQRYQVSTILSAELTDMQDQLSPGTDGNAVLALGLSNPINGLTPLPSVETELDQIVRLADSDPNGIYPGQEFLNQDFTLTVLEQNLRHSRIVHIATHGKFIAGLPEQSYLVLGDGELLPIQQIERLGSDLRNVNLVVLSACETALGGTNADGIEVAGIGSYFLAANRASTVVASLWSVNDNSTSLLMQQFYRNLAGGMGKAKALQQAQLGLLNTTGTAAGNHRTGDATITPVNTETGQSLSISNNLDHPYYWAPFILIGNGL